MLWEIHRYEWQGLRANGSTKDLPDAILSLKNAHTDTEAERAYWKIDNTVVVQGALYEAAVPIVTCLLGILQRCTPVGRVYILELLVQLGSGEPSPTEIKFGKTNLDKICRKELCYGCAIYFDLIQNGNSQERAFCIDLLGLCCIEDNSLKKRVRWYFERLLKEERDNGVRELIKNWLEEVAID